MQNAQIIIREFETCARCGAIGKFKIYSTHVGQNHRISYARCKVCDAKAKIIYQVKNQKGEAHHE